MGSDAHERSRRKVAPPQRVEDAALPSAGAGARLEIERPKEHAGARADERFAMRVPKSWIAELALYTGEPVGEPLYVLRGALVLLRHLKGKRRN